MPTKCHFQALSAILERTRSPIAANRKKYAFEPKLNCTLISVCNSQISFYEPLHSISVNTLEWHLIRLQEISFSRKDTGPNNGQQNITSLLCPHLTQNISQIDTYCKK